MNEEQPDQKTEDRGATGAPVPEALTELELLREFGRKYATHIVLGVSIVVAVLTVAYIWRRNKANELSEASQRWVAARTVDQLEEVATAYAATPAAPLAALRLAKELFNAGNYQMALAKYEEFGQQYPQHELAPAAELGKAFCLEAQMRKEEALAQFTTFATQYVHDALAPQAVLGRVRCLEDLGRYEQARVACEDFIAQNEETETRWRFVAEQALDKIKRKIEKQKTATAAAAAQPAAPVGTNTWTAPVWLGPVKPQGN